MQGQKCIICGKLIKEGIFINGYEICNCCEKRIINIEEDTDFYYYYIQCIKRTIVPLLIKGGDYNCQNYH